MGSWRRCGAGGLLSLGVLLATTAAQAFDILDARSFRENGYRSCQKCDLAGADLIGANLGEADLRETNLQTADLAGADLSKADLRRADLFKADLFRANLQGVRLGAANLQGAGLDEANLRGAHLGGADLRGARLVGADLANAQLSYVDFTNAIYAPASLPPNSYVAGIRGLGSVIIPAPGDVVGLVQLRKLLQEAGLPEEREAVNPCVS